MTKIGIDARFFGPKQKGLGRYVQKLIENLKNSGDFEFIIFLRKENFNNFKPPAKNFKKVLADWRWYTFAEQIFMPIKIWQEKVDLMHFPHFNVPIFCPTRFVVTIHDLVLKKYPTRRATTLNPLIYKIKELGYKLVLGRAVKGAQKIITPSNFTKNEILNYFKIRPEKIEVIYEGVLELPTNDKKLIANNNLLKEYGIENPYILYVGNAYPHKNLEGLISAFAKIMNNEQPTINNYQLVLVGEIDYFYKKLIENCPPRLDGELRLGKLKIENYNSMVFTGFVSDDELPELYKNAILYVSPAFSEGFGLPPLEAMSYGVPVIASKSGAQPEILGEAALYFNPKNIEDMTEKISVLLKDENLRKDLINRGYEQIKKYSWEKMAEETLKIYQSVFNTH